ncbi:3-oxoadipyl-CoA thiolase [SAR116 cluster bacterium]|jgi:3-oxoadipyl-CoA thiolase|nr:3-oxoadipyl-CoA thiolase [SAR116 cluster bacterium]|tara:strand:+ start:1396 stop:2601 length:1206 start_codon:yes stop_codon:yes gene_type:complete
MMDAFICDAIRTPIGRFGGALSSIRADDLAALSIKELKERNTSIDWSMVDEVIFGCANQSGEDNRNIARMSLLLAGLPQTVPGITINRLCASGLEAVTYASRMIKSNEAHLIIAGGVESMSRAPFVIPKSTTPFSRNAEIYDTTIGWRFINPIMRQMYGVDSMPETAENVAERWNISREDQDKFAYWSQKKAAEAISKGRFDTEIFKVKIIQKKEENFLDKDEHPRSDTLLEKLSTLPTPFRNNGTVTAGNASGVNDGSAALIIASEKAIKEYNLIPKARILSSAATGVEPSVMGIGPVSATKKVLSLSNINLANINIIELNEAFASQALATMRDLSLSDDDERVNINGGAIALGHPLGMSGARLVLTATEQLHQSKNNKLALCTMCVGVGQGSAIILEKL